MVEQTAPLHDVEPEPGVIEIGNVWINYLNYQVAVEGEWVPLTYLEFELLNTLVQRLDRVVPVDALTQSIWRETGRPIVGRLNVLIHRLRAKLTRSYPYHIEAVRGRGYGLLAVGQRQRTQ